MAGSRLGDRCRGPGASDAGRDRWCRFPDGAAQGHERDSTRLSTGKDPLGRLSAALAHGADHVSPIPRGASLVLAVSGGADSMALLAGACELRAGRGWTLAVAHLDHALRRGSSADAEFVRAEAEERALPFHSRRTDVRRLARSRGVSLEAAGREARYAFLHEVAETLGSGALIATAHTADDSAETVLLNLVRGSGISGLRGIPARRGRIVRPLLGVRRTDMRAWVRDAGIPFRDDPSNADARFSRNRVRAEVIPALERLNSAAVEALLRLARLAGDDDDVLTAIATAELGRRRLPGEAVRVDWHDPPARAIGRRVIRLAADAAPSLERTDALLDAAEGRVGGRTVELGDGLSASVRGRIISFSRSVD